MDEMAFMRAITRFRKLDQYLRIKVFIHCSVDTVWYVGTYVGILTHDFMKIPTLTHWSIRLPTLTHCGTNQHCQ